MPGNWNYYQVKRNVFHYAFTAKHIRLLPLAWNTEDGGKIGVRLELFGCPYGKKDGRSPRRVHSRGAGCAAP